MQTVVQVLCRGSKSLRDVITHDTKLEKHYLDLIHSKRQNRSPGWAKVRSSDGKPGALNFDWSASSRTLTCRVVSRGTKPYQIVGDFIAYLMARHAKRVITIVISRTQ